MKKYSTLNNYLAVTEANRSVLQKVFFALVLMVLVYNFYNGLFISQLGLTPLLRQELDPAYWLLMLLKLPKIIAGNKAVAICFDILLGVSAIAGYVKSNAAWPARFFWAMYGIYFFLFNLLSGHHYVGVGVLVAGFPFMFNKKNIFSLVYTGARYYFLFIFSSAAVWKIFRGTLFNTEQLRAILEQQNVNALNGQSISWWQQIPLFLTMHPTLAVILWILLVVLEAIFIIGFFTFRYDGIIVCCYIFFAAGTFLATGIFDIQNAIMLLLLHPSVNAALTICSTKHVATENYQYHK